jgi:hypothetical protein
MTNLGSRSLVLAVAATLATSFTVGDVAVAQKKMTYEQAFRSCKAELDSQGVFGTSLSASARTTAGAGCMRKHGYRLKKKSKL